MTLIFEIIEASPVEWGLLCNGHGAKTWWKSQFPKGKPQLNDPEVQRCIRHVKRIAKIQPARFSPLR